MIVRYVNANLYSNKNANSQFLYELCLIADATNNCTDVSKCLAYNGQWICLTQDQICDDVHDCYDFHDEMFCSLCFGKCSLFSLELYCVESSVIHDNLEQTEKFIKWENNILSEFISFQNLISGCELTIIMLDEKTVEYIEINIHTLHILHRARQTLMLDNILNWQGTEELKLSGSTLLQNWNLSTFEQCSTLKVLHISDLNLIYLAKNSFNHLQLLTELRLNIPHMKDADAECFNGLSNLRILYITNTKMTVLELTIFTPLINLHTLYLTNNMITSLSKILLPLVNLIFIDVRGTNIILNDLLFSNNEKLRYIYSDNYALCCIRPISVTKENCFATKFDVSSCEDLIENLGLSVGLWIFGFLSLSGNLAGLFYRKCFKKGDMIKDSYTMFIACLTVSDLLMSFYMLGIAFVDSYYRGIYVYKENTWRKSIMCHIFGMLSVISSEASVCFIAIITVDRYILVKYPFRDVKISKPQAFIVSSTIWCFCISLAIIPLFIFDDFYSNSGICTALPLRSNISPSWVYSFCVFVCFNFATFVFIALAQWPIFKKVKETVTKVRSTAENVELEVAKKLIMVVITDCLCSLPIGIMGKCLNIYQISIMHYEFIFPLHKYFY